MLARGSSARQTSTITFHRYYVTFTGCGRRSESTTRLLFSYIGVCTDLLRRTCLSIYRASRTCRRDSDYGHGRRTRQPSLRRTCPLSASDRAYPIAAARVWNTLSPDVRSSSSLSTFKRLLKTELFSRSFPD